MNTDLQSLKRKRLVKNSCISILFLTWNSSFFLDQSIIPKNILILKILKEVCSLLFLEKSPTSQNPIIVYFSLFHYLVPLESQRVWQFRSLGELFIIESFWSHFAFLQGDFWTQTVCLKFMCWNLHLNVQQLETRLFEGSVGFGNDIAGSRTSSGWS